MTPEEREEFLSLKFEVGQIHKDVAGLRDMLKSDMADISAKLGTVIDTQKVHSDTFTRARIFLWFLVGFTGLMFAILSGKAAIVQALKGLLGI